MTEATRPDPDDLLAALQKKQKKKRGGRLYLFLGMAPGVGKTYAMLLAAHEAKRSGVDVIVGIAETHGREETRVLLDGLEILPRSLIDYRNVKIEEFDIDAALARHPKLILIDELAHTNSPGSRHAKRWQDVFELLDAGIDVLSTMNIQHLESRKDSVEQIAGVPVRETVPDSVIDRAHEIRLIDLSPVDLLRRLKEGKVYLGERADTAAANFFQEDKLTALREIALRLVAEKVDAELQGFSAQREAGALWKAADRLMVPIGRDSECEHLLRNARRMAYSLEAPWIAVYVDTGKILSLKEKEAVAKNIELARSLGAEIITVIDSDWAATMVRLSKQKNITQLLIARSEARLLNRLLDGNVNVTIDAHSKKRLFRIHHLTEYFPIKSSRSTYAKAIGTVIILSIVSFIASSFFGYRSIGYVMLMGILILGVFVPIGPILTAATLSSLIWDYFFIPPTGTFYIANYEDGVMLVCYLIAALSTGILTWRLHRQQELLITRESRSEILYKTIWDIATISNKDAMLSSVLRRLEEALNGKIEIFLTRRDGRIKCENEREKAVARWSLDNNKPAGWSTDTLAAADALYIPLKGSSKKIGVLAFKPKTKQFLSPHDSDLIFTIARQLGISLEREAFRETAQEISRFQEVDKVHRTILNLIGEELQGPTQNFAIENLLLMSRLTVGIFPIHQELYSVEALLQMARDSIVASLDHHPIQIHIEPADQKIRVDVSLFKQVLANILMNAAEASPAESTISIDVRQNNNYVEISIADQGTGIPEEELTRIFEKFYRPPGAKGSGVGLGLSVAKGIVKVHGGKIVAVNRPEGGCTFTVSIPIMTS